MVWFILGHIFSLPLTWLRVGQYSDRQKDLEILLLRQQLTALKRHTRRPVRLSRVEKLTLVVLTVRLKTLTKKSVNGLAGIVRLVQPATVLKWYRELVRPKWTMPPQPNPGGRVRCVKCIHGQLLLGIPIARRQAPSRLQ